jgi:hypothetical protein
MINLSNVKDELQKNLKAECPLFTDIKSLKDSTIANWLDTQNITLKGYKWEDSGDSKSVKITGTSTVFSLTVDVIANFVQDEDSLVFGLTLGLPKDTKLSIPGLPKGPDLEDLALVLTSRMGEVESGLGDPIFFDTFIAAFDATIRLTGDLTIPIVLRLPTGDATDWTLQGNFEKLTLSSGLSSLASLAGGDPNWMSALPPQIQELGGFAFHDVGITFNPNDCTVSLISLVISSDKLDIIPGTLAIESPRIGINIYNVTDSTQRDVRGTFSGTIQIGGESGVDIFLSAEVPAMRFRGALADGTTLNFTALLGHLLPGVTLPKDAPDFVLHDLNVYVDATQKSFSIYARCFSDWEVIPKVVLSTVQVDLNYSDSMQCNLLGVFNIGGVDVSLSAAHPGGNSGWQFEGSTGAGEEIKIVDLLKDLGAGDESDLPASLAGLAIENLDISFNTQSKDFKFTGEVVGFKLDGQTLDFVLAIELKNQNGSYSKHFSGIITMNKGTDNEMEFDVIFDSKTDTDPAKNVTAFLAAYNNPKGKPMPIKSLVQQMSSTIAGPIPDSLSFTIKDALLAYLNTNENNKSVSKWLFGIDIDGGMNLSDLRLPDLPFVGPIFPPDQTLKLSFKLLAAKFPEGKSFSTENVSYVNGLLVSGAKLPNQAINAKLDLATILQIGQDTKSLDLKIGVDTTSQSTTQGTGAGTGTGLGGGNTGTPSPTQNTGLVPAQSATVRSTVPSAANVQSPGDDGMQWIVLQKSFGPVNFERVGLAFKNSEITGALDASLMAGGLTIALNGLSVSSPITKFDPKFDLHGLGIDYKNSGLEIGGAFLKQTMTKDGNTYTSFGGMAIIRTEKLTISAIGSYANYQNHPSMFIYAMLDYPIGGPAFFFVTGLAAGFGYNRGLNIPTIEALDKFPLIVDALNGAGPQPTDLAAKLASLESYIPPSVGENFLAIGIKFTSFKIVESFALLTVKFGGKLEFDLLGLSTLVSPPPEAGKSVPPVAKATLALKATFIPDDGIFSLQAQLTSDSFILSQACHLTGGFAFFCWFKDNGPIRAGDFVLTLGGYHPKYNVPAHYPHVPPLGINWQVSNELSIKGDAYFALTPQALMAGGHLEALWHSGDLSAWFKAGADFLICWKPYHYDAAIYVDIGASYTFELFGRHTITVDLGADLHLWGPEFAGTAEIHYYLFSVTIDFGDQGAQKSLPIDWDHFKASFLPAEDQVCTVAVQGGLVRQVKEDNGETRWIMNPKELKFATNSVIPISDTLSIAPMGQAGEGHPSKHIITIKRDDGTDVTSHFDKSTPIWKSVPAALWGAPQMDGEFLKLPDVNPTNDPLVDAVTGYEIKPRQQPLTPDTSQPVDRNKFRYETETIADAYRFSQSADMIVPDLQGKAAWDKADTQIMDSNAAKKRGDLLLALGFPLRVQDLGASVKQDVLI